MSRIFWDTNLFIYLWEWHGELHERVAALRKRMLERNDELCTSTLTLSELLVKPEREGHTVLARRYEAALTTGGVLLIPFDKECARHCAQVRLDQSIRPPDAIQLSCAARHGCDLFVTHDESLSRKVVRGIQFIVPLGRVFL